MLKESILEISKTSEVKAEGGREWKINSQDCDMYLCVNVKNNIEKQNWKAHEQVEISSEFHDAESDALRTRWGAFAFNFCLSARFKLNCFSFLSLGERGKVDDFNEAKIVLNETFCEAQ